MAPILFPILTGLLVPAGQSEGPRRIDPVQPAATARRPDTAEAARGEAWVTDNLLVVGEF